MQRNHMLKKIVSFTIVFMITAVFVSNAVCAYTTYTVGSYDQVNFYYSKSEEPVSGFQCYYEPKTSTRGARGGIHFNAGSGTSGYFWTLSTQLFYMASNGQLTSYTGENTDVYYGWVETPWATIPSTYANPHKIYFNADRYSGTTLLYRN